MVWQRLLHRHRDFAPLVRLVSPSFFQVVSGRDLTKRIWRLARSTQEKKMFQGRLKTLQPGLERLDVHVCQDSLASGLTQQAAKLDRASKVKAGEAALCTYFYTLLHPGREAPLDLRPQVFRSAGDRLDWKPKALFFEWDASFHHAIADLYGGFYLDDSARFQQALRALQLEAAGELFVQHFGEGDQTAVRFETRNLIESFDRVFRRCQGAGASLHGDFAALGFMLAALYDTLEVLNEPLNVRDAFERVSTVLAAVK